MIGDLLLIGLLLLLLFFFSSAETSLTVVSKPLMHQLELEGDRRAGLVNRLLEGRNRLLGSILLGNTLTQILASALATSLAIRLAGDVGVAYGTALMTIIVLLFCEILPKIDRAEQRQPAGAAYRAADACDGVGAGTGQRRGAVDRQCACCVCSAFRSTPWPTSRRRGPSCAAPSRSIPPRKRCSTNARCCARSSISATCWWAR